MPARFALALGLTLALIAPAAAQAATYTVDPADANSACSASDTTCPTIGQALQAAAAGDTVKVLKGTYAESVDIPSGKDGLKLEGAGIGDVKVTGSGTGDVVTIASEDVAVSGLSVETPGDAQSAVAVTAPGAKLTGVGLQRAAASSENEPVLDVTDAGTAAIAASFVVQSAGEAGTPAIRSSGAGLQVTDTIVVGSVGPALAISGGEANQVTRSTIASTQADSDGVQVLSDDAGNRALTVDSSVLLGGANAAGLLARSEGSDAGDIALNARHVTIALSAKGIVLDAAATGTPTILVVPGSSAGHIEANVASSIVHGVSEAQKFDPSLLSPGTANTAKLSFTNSDAPPATGDGTIDMGGASHTEDAKLFAPKSVKLRADAPVIDKGGPLLSGESDKDIDGNPRLAGAATDIGADEYVNQPPKAAFGITNKNPREGEATGFVSGSTDPEQNAGGGIVEYRWDFGDGVKETTKVGGVAHTYAKVGTYRATLQVVDAQGLVSDVSPAQEVVVKDGSPPGVAIAAPANNARLNLRSTYVVGKKRPKPKQLTILGAVGDPSGIESVEVALAVVKRDKVKKAKKKRKARKSQSKARCEFYSGRLFTKKKDCSKETWVKAKVVPGGWTLKTRKGLRLPAGRYQLKVRAKDKTGLLSSVFTTQARTLVNFRVR